MCVCVVGVHKWTFLESLSFSSRDQRVLHILDALRYYSVTRCGSESEMNKFVNQKKKIPSKSILEEKSQYITNVKINGNRF